MKKIKLDKAAAYTNSFIVALAFLLIVIIILSFLVKNLSIGQGIFLSILVLLFFLDNIKKISNFFKKEKIIKFGEKFHKFFSD